MDNASLIPLPSRAILRVRGPGARDFLQGLITNDMRHVTERRAIFAALLSPQGKFLHDFFVVQSDPLTFLLDTEASGLDTLLKTLARYRLRAQVTIEDVQSEYAVFAYLRDDADTAFSLPNHAGGARREGEHITFMDPRHIGMRARLIRRRGVDIKTTHAEGDYHLHRLTLAIPEGSLDATERSLVLDLGYDKLHGVDFSKGCYVGQEVTARMHYRSIHRKGLFQVVTSRGSLPVKGTPITADQQVIGEMRSSHKFIGLAMVQLEAWEAADKANTPFTAEGALLDLRLPAWAA